MRKKILDVSGLTKKREAVSLLSVQMIIDSKLSSSSDKLHNKNGQHPFWLLVPSPKGKNHLLARALCERILIWDGTGGRILMRLIWPEINALYGQKHRGMTYWTEHKLRDDLQKLFVSSRWCSMKWEGGGDGAGIIIMYFSAIVLSWMEGRIIYADFITCNKTENGPPFSWRSEFQVGLSLLHHK